MNIRYVWLLLASFVCGSFGFIGEMLDSIEDIPVRFVSGTCFLLLHKTYDPGEFEMRIRLNKPTIDLYVSIFDLERSWGYLIQISARNDQQLSKVDNSDTQY